MPQDWREVAYRRRTGVSIAGMKRSYNGRGSGRYHKRAFTRRAGSAMARGRFSGYYRRSGFYRSPHDTSPELKFFNTVISLDPVTTTGTVTQSINLIPQGVTESTRVGRKCVIKSILMKYECFLGETDAAVTFQPNDSFRMLLVLDKQCNGAGPAVLDILETAEFRGFNQISNKGRFRILKDFQVSLNYQCGASDGAGVVSAAGYERSYSFYKKLNIPLEFSSTTGAISEIQSNNLVLLLISLNGVAGFASRIRIRYTDR